MKMQVRINDQTFNVDIEDVHARPVIAKVDDEIFEVWPEETEEVPVKVGTEHVKQVLPTTVLTQKTDSLQDSKGVHAPLPGVIVSIEIKIGDTVKQGQTLCILEAMKMKNAIRATREGKISEIHINTGDQVKHGQLLISFVA